MADKHGRTFSAKICSGGCGKIVSTVSTTDPATRVSLCNECRAKRRITACLYCGTVFEFTGNIAPDRRRRFCSRSHGARYRQDQRRERQAAEATEALEALTSDFEDRQPTTDDLITDAVNAQDDRAAKFSAETGRAPTRYPRAPIPDRVAVWLVHGEAGETVQGCLERLGIDHVHVEHNPMYQG